jgi:heparinase II/III-like protein
LQKEWIELKSILKKRISILFFLVIGLAAMGTSTFIGSQELYFHLTKGGEINRSIWFIHPQDDRPAIVIVKDNYVAHNSNEEFSLVVHGIGNISLTENGAVWDKENRGVQVEIFGDLAKNEEKLGYNAEFKTMEPYIKSTFSEKGETKNVWVAIGLNGNKSYPITHSDNKIVINNQITIHTPDDEFDKLSVNTSYKPTELFEFYGDIFIESNDSHPFYMGSNIYDLTIDRNIPSDYGKMPTDTFEIVDGVKILVENDTVDKNLYEKQSQLSQISVSDLKTAISKLPTSSPWLYANDSQRSEILSKYNGSQGAIYTILANSIDNRAKTAMKYNFSDNRIQNLMSRSGDSEVLGFHAWLTQNQTEASQVVKLMVHMHEHEERIEEDHKMLHHGINLANYVLAWDFVEPLLNSSDNQIIKTQIEKYAKFVYEYLPDVGKNNWELVVSSGVGLAGLKLGNADMIYAAFEKLEHYITEDVRLEGGIYEGQGYIGYAFSSFQRFLIACANYNETGLPNYFQDRRFQAVYQFAVRCASPDGYYPIFEDANPGVSGYTNGFILAPFFQRSGQQKLAGELIWLFENHNINSTYSYIEKLFFADYNLPSVIPSLPSKTSDSLGMSTSYNGSSYVALDSGLAMFRNNWSDNTAYLTTSAKTYKQSHVHYDELTFEFWANGYKLLANPGYPGWGKEHHDWTIPTEASNGGVLFSNEGQSFDSCETGIVQWLRGREVDYIQLKGDGIYASPHNSLVEEHFVWVVPLGFGIGLISFLILRKIRKKIFFLLKILKRMI